MKGNPPSNSLDKFTSILAAKGGDPLQVYEFLLENGVDIPVKYSITLNMLGKSINLPVNRQYPNFNIMKSVDEQLLLLLFAEEIEMYIPFVRETGMVSPEKTDSDHRLLISIGNPLYCIGDKKSDFKIEIFRQNTDASKVTFDCIGINNFHQNSEAYDEMTASVVADVMVKFLTGLLKTLKALSAKAKKEETNFFYGFSPLIATDAKFSIISEITKLVLELTKEKRDFDWVSYMEGSETVLVKSKVNTTSSPKKRSKKHKMLGSDIPKEVEEGKLSSPEFQEWEIGKLVEAWKEGIVTLPAYQRTSAWKLADNRKLIASILRTEGLLVTDFITLGVENEDLDFEETSPINLEGKNILLINGFQRLTAILLYLSNSYAVDVSSFTGLAEDAQETLAVKMKDSGGVRFDQLSDKDKEAFLKVKLPICLREGTSRCLSKLFIYLNRGKPLLASESLLNPVLFKQYFNAIKHLAESNTALKSMCTGTLRGKTAEGIHKATESILLSILAAINGCYSGSPEKDLTSLSSIVLAEKNDVNVYKFISFVENFVDFVQEKDVEVKYFKGEFEEANIMYKMASPRSGTISIKPVYFVRLAEVFYRVLDAFAKATGRDFCSGWRLEFPWLYSNRETISKTLNSMVKGEFVAPYIEGQKYNPLTRDLLMGDNIVKLPFDDDLQWKEFLSYINEGMEWEAVENSQSQSLSLVYNDTGLSEESYDELVALLSLKVLEDDEKHSYHMLSNMFDVVSNNTNRKSTHKALTVFMFLFLFGIISK